MKKIYLFLTIILFTTSIALSQSNQWRNYYSSRCAEITFDGDNLWIGGFGLVKMNLETLDMDFYNSANAGLYTNFINTIAHGGENVWIPQLAGIFKYNGNHFSQLDTTGSNLPEWFRPGAFCATENDEVWFSVSLSYNEPLGLYHYNGDSWNHYDNANSGLPENSIEEIVVVNESVWIGTDNSGVAEFNGNTWNIYNTSNSGLASDEIKHMFVDEENNIWVATPNGICKYDGAGWSTIDISAFAESYFNCLFVNNDNDIWAGTSDGLYNFTGSEWIEYTEANSPLPNSNIRAIEMDDNGIMYFGTIEQWLVSLKDNTWEIYNISQCGLTGGGYDDIPFINVDNQNNKWILAGDLYKFDGEDEWTIYDENNSPLDGHNSAIYFDDNELAWIIDWEDGLRTFDGENWEIYNTDNSGIASNNVFDLAISESDTKWIATDVGVCKFDGENWVNYDYPNSDFPSTYGVIINCTDDNNVWVGTWGSGFALFNGTNWAVFNTSNSELPDNVIYSIEFHGDVTYLTTGEGIVKIVNDTWEIINTDNSDIPTNCINDITFDQNAVMWIATCNYGIVKFENEQYTVFLPWNSGLPGNEVMVIAVDDNNTKWFGLDDAGVAAYNEDGLNSIGEMFSSGKHINKLLFTPNPSQGNTSMEINISQKSDVLLKVYNNQGQLVYSVKYEGLENGTHSLSLLTSNFKNGYYHIQITADDNIWAGKLLVIN